MIDPDSIVKGTVMIETMDGHIVLTIGYVTDDNQKLFATAVALSEKESKYIRAELECAEVRIAKWREARGIPSGERYEIRHPKNPKSTRRIT